MAEGVPSRVPLANAEASAINVLCRQCGAIIIEDMAGQSTDYLGDVGCPSCGLMQRVGIVVCEMVEQTTPGTRLCARCNSTVSPARWSGIVVAVPDQGRLVVHRACVEPGDVVVAHYDETVRVLGEDASYEDVLAMLSDDDGER